MVFESVVASLLNKFLGDYVQNFDSSQLKLGIWGGDVTLKDLDVKESALDDLDLPIKVVSGHLGKLILKIPYKNIYTAPTTATIQGLHVVVVPNTGIKYDAEKEAKNAEATKKSELQRLEETKSKISDKNSGKEEKKDTFTEKLVTQIIKNLQVKITDIHLRYEDNFSDPQHPFSMGFTLHNLFFETTNEKWDPAVIQEQVNIIHKLVTLEGLAVYWNSNSELLHLQSAENRKEEMEKSIATKTFKPAHMKYLLGPINSRAQLKLNSKPETDGSGFKIPKVWLNVVMEEIAVGLSRLQYQDLIKLLESLDRMTIATLYRKYRPDVPKIGYAKEWWNFAITAVLEEDVRRKRRNWSWEHMKSHLDCCRRYKSVYVLKLLGKKFTQDKMNELCDCEKELDIFNITIVRKQAELEALRSSKKENKQSWGGWLGSFFGKEQHQQNSESNNAAKIAKQLEEAMTAEEKLKLYDAIGYQESSVVTEYPKEFVENKLIFVLHNLTVILSDDTGKQSQVLKANLKEVSASVDQRPAASAISFDAKIDSFIVQGAPSGNFIPTIVSSRQFVSSNIPLLDINFEANPLDESCDQRLSVQAQPLEITYDAMTVNNLIEVFKPPENPALQQLQATAMLKLEDLKEMSAFGLQYAIEQHKYLDLKIDMQPMFVVIPEKGILKDNSSLIVLSLGNFKMNSCQRDPESPTVRSLVKAGSTDEEVLSTMIDKAYDKFEIALKNIEVMLTAAGEDWREFIGKLDDPHHLLYPLTIKVDFQKSIVTIDPRMPQMRVVGVLPLLDIGISDHQIFQLVKIATSIPLPESDKPTTSEGSAPVPVHSLPSAVGADLVNAKVVQQIKREAVENIKTISSESEDDDSISSQRVPVQSTSLELCFDVNEFSFAISKIIQDKEMKMLKFAFNNFGISLTMRTFDMSADVYLGSILLEHSEFPTQKGEPLKMISTTKVSDENLFSLKYLSANKKAPDFETLYDSTLQAITADFKSIDVILHQEAILSIMDFANTMLSNITPDVKQSETPKPVTDSTRKESSLEKTSAKTVVSKKRAASQIIDIKLVASMELIRLLVCNKNYDLTDIKIKGMNASVTTQKAKICVAASLKDVIVSDPTPNAAYTQIISTVAGEVLDVKIIMFNNATDDENYVDMSAVDMSVMVSFGRMKMIFLNKFVSSLLCFLDHFQAAKDKVAEASVVAAEVAKQSMEDVYEKSTRILLNIIIEAPVIITPQHSRSSNAIVADLGILKIENKFKLGDKRNELGVPAIFEKMKLQLTNLQLFRALVQPDSGEILAECLILDPISFSLDIARNHSFSWFIEHPEIHITGELAAVKVTLSQDDYNTIMNVLNENLAETCESSEHTPITTSNEPQSSNPKATTSSSASQHSSKKETSVEIVGKIHPRFKFDFVLQSVTLMLCHGETELIKGVCERHKSCSMAAVEIKVLEVHAELMTDSSMLAKLYLRDVTLDDTRITRKQGVTRLMKRSSSEESNNMIYVEFSQTSTGDKRVQTTVSSFSLVFCLDYIMMLQEFFTGVPTQSVPSSTTTTIQTIGNLDTQPKTPAALTPSHSISENSLSQATGAMVIFLKVQKPDIVLIENIEDENSSAIFLNNEINLKVTLVGSSQAISGTISNLTFYTACFNTAKRKETSAKILTPCDIDIQCNFRKDSQHIDIMFRDLILHISPGTVQLLMNIMSSIISEPAKEESTLIIEEENFSDIWQPKPLKEKKFWFLEAAVAEDAVTEIAEDAISEIKDVVVASALSQQMLFTMRKIIITVEAGVGARTVPLLLMESSFQAHIRDWSVNLYVGSSFSLEMSYYNEKIAVWEPIIEPIETARGHRSWELMLELTKDTDISESRDDDDEPEIMFAPPQMSISIIAQDVLQLTVSKTCLDIISTLSQAFQEAVSKAVGKESSIPYAPFHVNNYLGVPVNIILTNGMFQILNEEKEYNCVKLESGCPALHLTYRSSRNDDSSRLSILKKQDTKEDTYFNIMICETDMTIERKISIACTDKRYFQLPRITYPGNRWGFCISIQSLYGSKFITFHSILQVCNHFSMPIDVYFMKQSNNEVEWCCSVDPDKSEYLPLHAIYTTTSELFFKPKHLEPSYTLTLPPFAWKDLVDDPSTEKIVFCKDKGSTGKPFYMSVAGEAERILYEETNRKTMASSLYKMHLNPTAILRNLLLYPIHYSMQGVNKDYCLAEGESNDLWAIDLDKNGIEIRLNNYLDRTWTCFKVLKKEVDELSVWVFDAPTSDRTLHLELGMHTQKINGCLVMQLYSPFCMVNKTGLMLTYRRSKKFEKFEGKNRKLSNLSDSEDSGSRSSMLSLFTGDENNIIRHPAEINPVLFSFKAKSFFAKKKASLKINDSEWSDKFSLDAVGSSGTVVAKTKNGKTYGIGVQIKLSQAGLTKMVIFTPYYLLVNNCKNDIEVLESGTSEWIKVLCNECNRFWPTDTTTAEMIVRYAGEEEQTTAFSFKEGHHTLLSLMSKKGGIVVDCQITESSVILTFEDYLAGHGAVLLVNNFDELEITFNQSEVSKEIKVLPQTSQLFTWQNPIGKRLLKWTCGNDEGEHDLVKDGIGELKQYEDKKLYWVTFLDGVQRVLMFTHDLALATAAQEAGELERVEQEITISLQGVGMSLVNNDTKSEILYMSITSTGIIWEARKKKAKRFKPLCIKEVEALEAAYQKFTIETKVGKKPKPATLLNGKMEVDFNKMLMTKPNQRILKRTYAYGLWLDYKTSPHQVRIHAKINYLQIDNQLMDCVFPVVLAPVPPPKSVAATTAPKSFTELSVMLRKAEHSAVHQFKFCGILIQEFHIKLDQGFINSILLFFTPDQAPEIDHIKMLKQDKETALSTLKDVATVYSSQENQYFFDNLHFSPLKVHISFSMTGASQEDNKPTPIHSDFLNLLLQSVGVTLTEIQDVVFKLDYFERNYVFMSQNQLISEVSSHYIGQAVKQVYMLVLGLDVIGNPVGLLLGLGTGVTDLFYEPIQGAIQGPEEFAEGLAIGVKSLFGHAIGGAAGAASRITGTLGKGIAALTLDKEYQKKRQQNLSRKPQDFTHGIAQSGKGLVMGVFDGVTGIVTKPIEGAKEGGVGGFFKGVGKGLIGVVTRPTAGVVDFASGSLDAVKRVTQVSDETKRIRVPRFIKSDGIIRPYVTREAEGNKLLQEVEKGKYANTDVYLAHTIVGDGGNNLYFLVTNNRIMYIEKGDIFGQWNTVWEYLYEELKGLPEVSDKGLKIMLKSPHKTGLFSKSVAGKHVVISDLETRQWIADKIKDAMTT